MDDPTVADEELEDEDSTAWIILGLLIASAMVVLSNLTAALTAPFALGLLLAAATAQLEHHFAPVIRLRDFCLVGGKAWRAVFRLELIGAEIKAKEENGSVVVRVGENVLCTIGISRSSKALVRLSEQRAQGHSNAGYRGSEPKDPFAMLPKAKGPPALPRSPWLPGSALLFIAATLYRVNELIAHPSVLGAAIIMLVIGVIVIVWGSITAARLSSTHVAPESESIEVEGIMALRRKPLAVWRIDDNSDALAEVPLKTPNPQSDTEIRRQEGIAWAILHHPRFGKSGTPRRTGHGRGFGKTDSSP